LYNYDEKLSTLLHFVNELDAQFPVKMYYLTSATNILKHYMFDYGTALCDILYKRVRNTLTN